ncbi:MAG: NF038122 family metalloprotease, partial [Planctomycetota bacterium]
MLAVIFTPPGSDDAGTGDNAGTGIAAGNLIVTAESELPFDIQFNYGATIRTMPGAIATMEAAARQWESRIADPVTVVINVDLNGLPPGVLGGAITESDTITYPTLREAMVSDAVAEFVVDENGNAVLPDRETNNPIVPGIDDNIVQFLPHNDQLRFNLPAGTSIAFQDNTGGDTGISDVPINGPNDRLGLLTVNRATQKALGLLTPGPSYRLPDGQIVLSNSTIAGADGSQITLLDYSHDDDQIDPGQFDALTVAVHEIGHILGFNSAADFFGDTISPTPMDLFRFTANFDFLNPQVDPDPDSPNPFFQFQTFTRELNPVVQAITDFGTEYWPGGTDRLLEVPMAEVNAGQQTSHWERFPGQNDFGVITPKS